MNVLVFGPYAIWTPHLETDLEIIQRHLDQGDEVNFLGCNSKLMACDPNPYHAFRQCATCIGRRRHGLSLLSDRINSRSFYNFSRVNKQELSTLQLAFSNLEELKAYKVDNFDIGYAVLSSIIGLTRNPVPDLQTMHALVKDFVISAFTVYRSVQNYLDQLKVNLVYIFNGRMAPLRAAVRACESRNIPFFTHERGNDLHHYAVFENTLPHDLQSIELDILKQWESSAQNPQRNDIAAKYFIERRNGIIQSWLLFTEDQQDGLLPSNWDSKKRNIVVFSSSEDEYAAISDAWTSPLYPTQLEGMQRILKSFRNNSGSMHLYFRLHPNLKGVKNDYTQRLLELKEDLLTVIPPEDPISTYSLIEAADKVLTFGSTVGIEAVYWGTPSILAGQSFFRNLGGTYNPRSHNELIALLKTDLKPKDKQAALVYGYYMKTYGIPFKYFTATSILDGKFKGKKIQRGPWASALLQTLESFSRLKRFANVLTRLVGA
jgi:Capsule polysaccharide biosynthesis protein